MYDKLCVAARSMPFWCVANPLADPFGGNVQPKPDSLDVAKMLAKACKAGLIEMTSTHDDDLVPWDPEHPEDDLDPKSEVYKKLRAIKKVLRDGGLKVNMVTCSLHGNPIFRAIREIGVFPRLSMIASYRSHLSTCFLAVSSRMIPGMRKISGLISAEASSATSAAGSSSAPSMVRIQPQTRFVF